MPASLYRLAGRPHHADASNIPVVDQTSVDVEAKNVDAVYQQPVQEASINFEQHDQIAVESSESVDQLEKESEASPVSVTWDPSWSKAQLLNVALQLNLNVTSANTRSQIVEALTLATST